ncbi:MAG: hypothetical protein LBV78_10125, partial [Kitasatospora sp.]|nr:hypothetical protein [Kitasatospora sp.]
MSGPRRPGTGLLDRPAGAAHPRAVPPPRRSRGPVRSRLALSLALVQTDVIALCTAGGIANRAFDPAAPLDPLLGVPAV